MVERNGRNVSLDEKPSVSAGLCRLLTEQIALARKGDFAGVEQRASQAESLVAKIAQGGVVAADGAQRDDWERLYDELLVILRTEKGDVQGELKQLRQVRRAVDAYGGKGLPHSKTRRPSASSHS